VLEGLNYQACACIICGGNNRQNCDDACIKYYFLAPYNIYLKLKNAVLKGAF